jgi:hypothetical protein
VLVLLLFVVVVVAVGFVVSVIGVMNNVVICLVVVFDIVNWVFGFETVLGSPSYRT